MCYLQFHFVCANFQTFTYPGSGQFPLAAADPNYTLSPISSLLCDGSAKSPWNEPESKVVLPLREGGLISPWRGPWKSVQAAFSARNLQWSSCFVGSKELSVNERVNLRGFNFCVMFSKCLCSDIFTALPGKTGTVDFSGKIVCFLVWQMWIVSNRWVLPRKML